MFPSKRQWKRWTLPSKYSAISTLIGIIAFVWSVLLTAPCSHLPPERLSNFISNDMETTMSLKACMRKNPFEHHREFCISHRDKTLHEQDLIRPQMDNEIIKQATPVPMHPSYNDDWPWSPASSTSIPSAPIEYLLWPVPSLQVTLNYNF